MKPVKNLFTHIIAGKTRTTLALQQISHTAVYRGVNILVSFVYVPLLLNYLEPERYGVWLTLIAVVNWITIFDLGLGNGLRNKLTEALAHEDYSLARTYISTTYAIIVIIFLPLMPLFYVISKFIDWSFVFNTSIIEPGELLILVNIVFTLFCMRIIAKIIGAVFKAHQKPAMENLVVAVSSFVSLACVFVLTKIQPTPNLILLGSVIAGIPVMMYTALSLYIFATRYKKICPAVKYVDFQYKNVLLKLGAQFFIIQFTYTVIYSTYNIIILHLFGSSEVVRFNIAFKLFSVPIMLYTIMLSPVWSAVTDAYVRKDYDWLKVTLKRLNIFSLLMLGFTAVLLLFSSYIYRLWIGTEIDIPFHLSAGLAVYTGIFVMAAPYSSFVNGFGRMKLTTSVSVADIILFYCGIFVLARAFNSSLTIAAALCITSLFGFTVRYIQTHKILNKTATGIWAK